MDLISHNPSEIPRDITERKINYVCGDVCSRRRGVTGRVYADSLPGIDGTTCLFWRMNVCVKAPNCNKKQQQKNKRKWVAEQAGLRTVWDVFVNKPKRDRGRGEEEGEGRANDCKVCVSGLGLEGDISSQGRANMQQAPILLLF